MGTNSTPVAPPVPKVDQSYHHVTPGEDAVGTRAAEAGVLVAMPRLHATVPPSPAPELEPEPEPEPELELEPELEPELVELEPELELLEPEELPEEEPASCPPPASPPPPGDEPPLDPHAPNPTANATGTRTLPTRPTTSAMRPEAAV